jgi:hypothetical protein
MSSSRSSVSSSFGTTSNANNNSSSSSSSNQALSHTTTSTTISTASTMLDGGPPPWDLVAALLPAPGLLYYEHCRVAASIYAETARRMVTTGQLQHVKTLAILRTWDLYNYRCGFDITCGASDMIFRCLAMLGVQVDENGASFRAAVAAVVVAAVAAAVLRPDRCWAPSFRWGGMRSS